VTTDTKKQTILSNFLTKHKFEPAEENLSTFAKKNLIVSNFFEINFIFPFHQTFFPLLFAFAASERQVERKKINLKSFFVF